MDPEPRLQPQTRLAPRPQPAAPVPQRPSARPQEPSSGGGWLRFAALALMAAGLAAGVAFRDDIKSAFSFSAPAQSLPQLSAPPAVLFAARSQAPEPAAAVPVSMAYPADPVPAAPTLAEVSDLVPYAQQEQPRTQPQEQAQTQPAQAAPAPHLRLVPALSNISAVKGSGEGGLRLSGLDNKQTVILKQAGPAKAAADKPWRVVPCAWSVWKKDGVCINESGTVTTQHSRKVCRQWGATDCMGW